MTVANGVGMSASRRGVGARIGLWVLRGVLILVVLTLGMGLYMRLAYPGFVKDIVSDLQYGTLAEFKTKYSFFWYYGKYYELLRLNPKTNMYDLELPSQEAHASAGGSGLRKGQFDIHNGRFQEAIREIQADIQDHGENEEKLFWLALGYMRAAEAENCLTENPDKDGAASGGSMASMEGMAGHDMGIPHPSTMSPFSCSLPLMTFHQKKQWSQNAAKTFEQLLDRYDASNPLYRWLLNFSYMTINEFPAGVPEKYRIQSPFIDLFYGKAAKAAREAHPDIQMEDRAAEFGVNTFDAGKGVAIEDFNGDGWLDIVTGGTFSETRYYQNDHGKRFIDRSKESGLSQITQAYMITTADYDNDGRMDVLVSRPFQYFALMHNNGNGTFTDETIKAGLLPGDPGDSLAVYTCVTAWADVNKDGKLDLFVAHFAGKFPFLGGLLGRKPMPSRLYVNQGGGKFADLTDQYGLTETVTDNIFIGATFSDYNSDDYPDLFLSSPSRKRSVLLKNVNGTRFEVTDLIDNREPGFTTSFIDINHDSKQDIFQGTMSLSTSSTANGVMGRNPKRFASKIWLQKDGAFENHSDYFDGDSPIGTMGASFGDINNDGCYDFYLGTGSPEGWFVLPNLMFLGKTEGTTCTGRMENISMLNGAGTVQKGHAIVFADINDDGLQDIYSSLGGMWPGDSWTNQLFINKSTMKNSWVKIRLRGRQTNRYGVGTSLKITAVDSQGAKFARTYNMDGRTGFGSAPNLAHVGLLNAASIEKVEVHWPVSGKTVVYPAKLGNLNLLDEDGSAKVEAALAK
ncbi:MAG: CRTAC1 family protein [Bryobacteraceae bacterium]